MFRKLLLIFGLSLGVVAGMIGAFTFVVHRYSAPVVAAADRFVAEVAAGNTSTAHAMLTESAKKAITFASPGPTFDNPSLKGMKDIAWSTRSVRLDIGEGVTRARTEGSATLASGRRIEIKMAFLASGDVWLVDAFDARSND